MGGSESQHDWQDEYVSLSLPNANPKYLKHKITDQRCQLLSLPIIPQFEKRYTQRLQLRTGQNRSKYLTPLVKWQQNKDKMVCGSKQNLNIIVGEISPTLQDFLRYRKAISINFTEQQILYIIHNIAYGLKDVQMMKEQHGYVDLTTICITNDVFLKDPMIIEEELKLEPERKSSRGIEGYPSPQKLKSYYDSLSGFQELRGDLFSLGLVALQLYHSNDNIKSLYNNPNPAYRNYTINLQALSQKIQNIPFYNLKNAISILTNLQSKKRLQIYQLLRGVRVDPTRLSMLRQNFPIIAESQRSSINSVNISQTNSYKPQASYQRTQMNIPPNHPQIHTINASPQLQLKSSSEKRNFMLPKVDDHYQPYQPYQPQVTQSLNYQPFKLTNYELLGKNQPISTSPPKTRQENTSQIYQSSYMTTSAPLFAHQGISSINGIYTFKKDSSYFPDTEQKQSIGMTYYPTKEKATELTYTSKQPTIEFNPKQVNLQSDTKYDSAITTSKIPTFQQILNKVRSNDPNSLLNKLPPSTSTLSNQSQPNQISSTLPQYNSLSSQTESLQSEFLSYSAFQKQYKDNKDNNVQEYVPRSGIIQGSESIYHEEKLEKPEEINEKNEEKEIKVQNDKNNAYKTKNKSQQAGREELPQNNEQQKELKQLQEMDKETTSVRQGINQATSTVSAIPEEPDYQNRSRDSATRKPSDQFTQNNHENGFKDMKHSSDSIRIEEEPQEPMQPYSPTRSPQTGQINLFQNMQERTKIESKQSYRSIGSIKSDPRIVVNEPLQTQPVSPIRNRAIFVNEEYEVGTKYQGYMLEGKRHGKGKFFYKEGSYYDGEWKENKMHGFGTLYYPDGRIAYQGEWKEDQFDGKGKVFNDQQRMIEGSFDFTDFNQLDDEWIKYEGELKNDAKEGFGTLYLTNGEVYQGQFYHDMVHGVGMFKSDKSQKRGVWQNGKLKKLL